MGGFTQYCVLLGLVSAGPCNVPFETFCMCLNFHSYTGLNFDPKILPSSIQCVRVEASNNSVESRNPLSYERKNFPPGQ
jgi:hypothetical protein